jgi:hypothetical protein
LNLPPAVSPELKARILAAARTTPSATRSPTLVSTRLLVPVAAVLAGCLYFAFDGLHHGQGRPPGFLSATVAVWIGAALVSLWSVVGASRSPTGRPRAWLLAVALGMPVLVLILVVGVSFVASVTASAPLLETHRPGLRCLVMTVAAAVVPVLGFLFVRRGSDPLHPAAHGAAIGASFGAYAGIMVCFWCPDPSPFHAALGHVAPLLLLALLGAGVGARVLDLPRDAPRAGPR